MSKITFHTCKSVFFFTKETHEIKIVNFNYRVICVLLVDQPCRERNSGLLAHFAVFRFYGFHMKSFISLYLLQEKAVRDYNCRSGLLDHLIHMFHTANTKYENWKSRYGGR